MNNNKLKLKRNALNTNVYTRDTINAFIQPFKEMPSINDAGMESTDRINAHELFSFYTADIIREEVIFVR